MAKKANAVEATEAKPVRLTIEQVAMQSKPIFVQADEAEDKVDAANTLWLDYARQVVNPHIGAVLFTGEDKVRNKAKEKFRSEFYANYIEARAKWTPVEPARDGKPASCLADYRHYCELSKEAKGRFKAMENIKTAISRARVFFNRVWDYAEHAYLRGDDESETRNRKTLKERFAEKIESIRKLIEKMRKEVDLGDSAQAVKNLENDILELQKFYGKAK